MRSYIQGDVGEVVTAQVLRELGLNILRNVYLPYRDAQTEIDIIGISEKGIFIIENKNYSGIVRGTSSSSVWTVNGVEFLNPVHQNSIHVNAVKSLLDIKFGRFIFNVVIFNDKIKSLKCDDSKRVFKLSQFVEVYKGFTSVFLSTEEVNYIYDILSKYSDSSLEARVRHLIAIGGIL